MRPLWLFLLLFFALPSRAETPSQIPNPLQTRRSFVADSAGVLSDADERRLQAILAPLERRSGTEIAVVTVHNLGGQSVEDFAGELFSLWKVGKKDKDNGAIILVAIDDRKSRIQLGYGLEEKVTDGQAGELLRDQTRPAFRRGDYATGLYDVTLALAQKIDPATVAVPAAKREVLPDTGPDDSSPMSSTIPTPSNLPSIPARVSTPRSSSGPSDIFFVLFGLLIMASPFLVIGGLIWLVVARLRRAPRCPKCKTEMVQLSEAQEEPLLNSVQKFEQRIGARDYRIWQCPACHTEKVDAHDNMMSGYSMCPKCRNKTARSTRRMIESATEFRQGLEETSIACELPGCGYTSTYRRSTSRLPSRASDIATGAIIGSTFGNSSSNDSGWSSSSNDSSSDSSSSSSFDSGPSDFGGGDSGGGGASDSW